MQSHATPAEADARRHRPKTLTVFAAAFAAGAVLAYGVNRVVDVHTVQVEPQVESEPIFVALRSLPQGSPITVWDVALKDWPKAMMPTTALKADAVLEGMMLKHPIREGQPLLSVQLVRDGGTPPMTAIVAAAPADVTPTGSRPATADVAAAERAVERFVPATPAESPVMPAADVAPPPAAVPPTNAAVAPAGEPVPVAAVAAAAAPAAPRSTDVDEPAPVPAVVEPTPFVPAPVEPPAVALVEPTPVPLPEPAPLPAPIAVPAAMAVADRVPAAGPTVAPTTDAPLAAPVPALPSTDIGRSLTEFGRTIQPPAPSATPSQGEPPVSVLDRTTEAAPPTARSAPKYHLVVPERIALAVDASFTQPRPSASGEGHPAAERPAADAPSAVPQARSGARRPQATAPTMRKPGPQQRPQPAARPTAAPTNRGVSAWMPKFMGDGRRQ